jgi:hypothetical protein
MDQAEQDIPTWGETRNDNGDETNAKILSCTCANMFEI